MTKECKKSNVWIDGILKKTENEVTIHTNGTTLSYI